MIKYIKSNIDNSDDIERIARFIGFCDNGASGDWKVIIKDYDFGAFYTDIYYKNELVAFVYWHETLYTLTTDKDILNQLYALEDFDVYDDIVDCTNPISNVYMTRILSTMSMIENFYLAPTEELAVEVKDRYMDCVYDDSEDCDAVYDEFDTWMSENGIEMLDGDNQDYTVLPHDLLVVDIPTKYNSSAPAIYKMNIAAEWAERF